MYDSNYTCVLSLSVVSNSLRPMHCSHQAPLSTGFSRQEYGSGLPRPPPGDLPDPGIETRTSASKVDSLPAEPPGKLQSHDTLEKVRLCSEKISCQKLRDKGRNEYMEHRTLRAVKLL